MAIDVKSLEKAMSEIKKKYGDPSIFQGSDNIITKVDVISTGSLTFDSALGVGGVPRGRIVEFSGPESGGKTLMALSCVKEAQKMGLKCVFIDAEHSLDKKWCEGIGIKWDDLIIAQPETFEQALQTIRILVSSGSIGLLVLDSVPALPTEAEVGKEAGERTVSSHALILTSELRKLTPIFSSTNTCGIFINQLREKIGVMYGNPETTPGGRALKHAAAVRVRVAKKGGPDCTILDENKVQIGHKVRIRIEKNKVATPYKEAEFDVFYTKGIDQMSGIVQAAIDKGIITKPSEKKYAYKDKEWVGYDNTEAAIRADDKLAKEILKQIQQSY